jgi:RNA polymerase sigma-70 factor (sigma-E family)
MAGDDPDFLEFFAAEFWPLRRVGFLLTGSWDQAEELAQEAMARTYAVWPRVRRYQRPAAYARKVLVNRHRSVLRRAVVEARHLVTSRPQDRHEPEFGGDDLVLWQALQQLSSRQRAGVVLRYYLDLPEAEVARLLGVPLGTVKSLVHRGLARLRDQLGPEYAAERLTSNTSTEDGP